VEVHLPSDHLTVTAVEAEGSVSATEGDIPEDRIGVDIGPRTARRFAEVLFSASTVFWNGPMGIFERAAYRGGTEAVARALVGGDLVADQAGRTVVVGGGDSAAAVERLGLLEQMTHVSTGGGAALEFLSGKVLPGVAALS
jgi:phosphoglycerate kinase